MSDVLTADGRVIQIRPVGGDEARALERLYTSVSAESRHSRFFSLGTGVIADEVQRLTRVPAPDHAALVAEEAGHLLGAASYERIDTTNLNPLLIFQHGITAVDLKLRLNPIGAEPDATQRVLRA